MRVAAGSGWHKLRRLGLEWDGESKSQAVSQVAVEGANSIRSRRFCNVEVSANHPALH